MLKQTQKTRLTIPYNFNICDVVFFSLAAVAAFLVLLTAEDGFRC